MTGSAANDGINPFMARDINWLLDRQAVRHRDKDFLVWEPFSGNRRSWTYGAFAEEVRALAAGLHGRGIRHGDFVILHMSNAPEFLTGWFACTRLGAIPVCTNINSTRDEMAYFVAQSGASAALTHADYVGLIANAGPHLRWIAWAPSESTSVPDAASGGVPVISFAELAGDPRDCPTYAPDPDATACILFTSGTTSRPKGVEWTHANTLWLGRCVTQTWGLRENDVAAVYLPLFHTNALGYSMLGTLWAGGTMVLLPKFSASRFWQISVRNRCTWATFIPFTQRAVEMQSDPERHHYRLWISSHSRAIRERYGVETASGFGMTETVGPCLWTDHGPTDLDYSLGTAVPGYEIAVRRVDGSPADIGEQGRLLVRGVRGVSMFKGYLRDPAVDAADFDAHGWFDTGDIVICLGSGELAYVGRGKDMLKVGGENVAAAEIEMVIAGVPGVREVAVVARPHAMLDEVPVAFVVTETPGEVLRRDVIESCAAKLSEFKRPREVLFRDSLPRGTLDKILKRVLRDEAVAHERALFEQGSA